MFNLFLLGFVVVVVVVVLVFFVTFPVCLKTVGSSSAKVVIERSTVRIKMPTVKYQTQSNPT